MTDKTPVPPKSRVRKAQRGGVQMRESNDIWKVQVDDMFRGDSHQKEHALAAAALHKVSPR